jgi:hypothetical protein
VGLVNDPRELSGVMTARPGVAGVLQYQHYLRADCHKQAITHIRESRQFELMYTL